MTEKENKLTNSNFLKPTRKHYLDHLKLVLTLLVIAHHASQAYAASSGLWLISNPTKSAILDPFQVVNATFFMGLFFLISGYFTPGAYDHKGVGAFLKSRVIRLGIPVLFFALFIFGPIGYFSSPERLPLIKYIGYLYKNGWQLLYAHLWFLVHLLVYNLGYALWRIITKHINFRVRSDVKLPWHVVLLIFVLILALVAWVIRFRYAINQWIPLLFVIPAEMFHLPQYVLMFILGILVYRYKALDRLPTAVGMVWLGIGVVSAAVIYANILGKSINISLPISGRNAGSLIWSAWEALICVGLGTGLLILFRELINKKAGRLMAAVMRAQYGAYIIHLLVVIGVQVGISGFPLTPFVKFLIATIFGAILSFGISHFIVKIPGIKKVI